MKYVLIATIASTLIYFSGALPKIGALWETLNGGKIESLVSSKIDNKTDSKAASKTGNPPVTDDLARARDSMFAMSFTPSAQCMNMNKSSLEALQCKNEKEQAYASFKAKFDAKLATGWRPQ